MVMTRIQDQLQLLETVPQNGLVFGSPRSTLRAQSCWFPLRHHGRTIHKPWSTPVAYDAGFKGGTINDSRRIKNGNIGVVTLG